ncbi:PTS sugar transporter subunit IIB [Propionispora vibrioides]|uniref:PTS system, mannose-specific IIB component n=1 Tax=Propionispora vibrioides TaxID=112903 RepID=A0A1H8XWB1_9FIRM|nr:PTS sugar transporter subunit IIB [Propionispora vibrioides]SEP44334.1 PTS system, mannose-specific IIB component [Propionispora vibrioides]
MAQIVFSRVDDRLIHGQVVTSWLNYSGANHIIIVDDLTAQDDFVKMILKGAVPPGYKMTVLSIADMIATFTALPDDKVFLLVKTPAVILALAEAGIDIKELNVGGMGGNAERSKFYKNISMSEAEKDCVKKLLEKGLSISIQVIPQDKKINIEDLL